jgi:hypothetical protein
MVAIHTMLQQSVTMGITFREKERERGRGEKVYIKHGYKEAQHENSTTGKKWYKNN